MKKNIKNKIAFIFFIILIFVIVSFLIYGIIISRRKDSFLLDINNNCVLFDKESNGVDTVTGGKVEKRWDNEFYFINQNEEQYSLGSDSVVYDKSSDNIYLLGANHLVEKNGNVKKNNNLTTIYSDNNSYFFKLADRKYLIISKEIKSSDESLFTKKYLVITLDKQGNASLLNDSININTINPMVLTYSNFRFDVANEKLFVAKDDENGIDLKSINGSTNEYIPVFKVSSSDETKPANNSKLTKGLNELIYNFNQYVSINKSSGGYNEVNSYNNVVINGMDNTMNGGSNNNTNFNQSSNVTNYINNVSLRGLVAGANFIDVSYLVTDPYNKFQTVYLLVSDGVSSTKIIIDKYNISYRIYNLEVNTKYTISLGYIETIDANNLEDSIVDVVNIKTKKPVASFKIDKLSNGYVYYTLFTDKNYRFSSGTINFYVDDFVFDSKTIDDSQISNNSYSDKFKLEDGFRYDIKLEDVFFDNVKIDYDISRGFVK